MDDLIAFQIIKISDSRSDRTTHQEIIRLAGYNNLNGKGGARIPLENCSDRQLASAARDYVSRAKNYIDGLKSELQEAIRQDSHVPIEVEYANRMYDQFNVPFDQRDFVPLGELENIIQYH